MATALVRGFAAAKLFRPAQMIVTDNDGAKRQAAVVAGNEVTILRVSASLLEQASSACQLRFNKVFLKSLISRLQHGESRGAS